MKKARLLLLFCCAACVPLPAQLPSVSPVDALRHPAWNKGIFAGGGTSVDSTPSGQNLVLGFRLGRVLTGEHGSGILRGTYEMAIDIIPLDEYWIRGGQYAGGIDPLVAKWNFTSGCRIAPYAAVVGGVLFSTHNLPPGDTYNVNFTSGAEIGAQIFGKERNSWDVSVKAYHLSNASLGNHNPGLNANLQFMLGYTWH
ncbi:MAG TPA: acyloxyacyl hydrolase [Candidatus Binatia bacterium]|nr:acyloxyacyl hydrolase [Candidatus Binatia bacterium]